MFTLHTWSLIFFYRETEDLPPKAFLWEVFDSQGVGPAGNFRFPRTGFHMPRLGFYISILTVNKTDDCLH